MKNLYYKQGKLKNFKSKSIQIFYNIEFNWLIDFMISINSLIGDKFDFVLNLFSIFEFKYYITKESDHAGTTISLNLFGLNIEYQNIDCRHWDYKTNTFENEILD